MSSCYTSWKTAKTGEEIPCYANNKPSSSLYNPQKEAEQFSGMVGEGFTLIAGFTSGLHVQEIKKKYPQNKVVVVERNNQTIRFLQDSDKFEIKDDIILCTCDTLEKVLINAYFPPVDGNFAFYPVRSWVDENEDIYKTIKANIKSALDRISYDISTQAHFGKLWHRNIIQNLQICENSHNAKLLNFFETKFPTTKTAFIAGAGPSLESSFNELKTNRQKYYIFATDTAFCSLSEHGIVSDVVLSVDAQHISYNHFLCEKNMNTIFAFDLCAHSTAVKNIIRHNRTLCYFKSEHPLCTYIENWHNSLYNKNFFPTISSGGGTVAVSALQFAMHAGFTDIKAAGCDFAFLNDKMYAKGVYMDKIFNKISNKLQTVQNLFSSIMFRNELLEVGNKKTTVLLQNYKKSYDDCLKNFVCNKNTEKEKSLKLAIYNGGFPASIFLDFYVNKLRVACSNSNQNIDQMLLLTLLPYIAWYSRNSGDTIKKINFFEIGLNATIHN